MRVGHGVRAVPLRSWPKSSQTFDKTQKAGSLRDGSEKQLGLILLKNSCLIDPELLIRMLLVGYCLGIRSERRHCEEVHLNLAYRWFCLLDLTDRIPDHSTCSKNRHGRFRESDLVRQVFEMTVARCMQEGLGGGQGFAVDASLIHCPAGDLAKPNLPRGDNSKRKDGTWSRADFTWDEDNDRYICPEGKELRHTRRNYSDPARHTHGLKARNYGALKSDCHICPSKAKCCPNTDTRRIRREKYEIVRDFARECTASDFNTTDQKRRKKVEMLFAHLKRILSLGRLRLRGPCGVQDEFTLAATAQNLRKLAKLKLMVPATG